MTEASPSGRRALSSCLEEARRLRAFGRQVLDRVEESIAAGELEELSLSELLSHVQTVCTLMEVGQRLEYGLELEQTLARLDRVLRREEGL